jgi:tRNA(adenine34) deaminase
MPDHDHWMELALAQAKLAPAHGDVPVGAVLVGPDGEVVAADHNRREDLADPTAHAEMLVISQAARQTGDWRLAGHLLFVTLEPCAMCAGAAVWARLAGICYGAADPKAGAAWSLYNIPQDPRLNHQCELIAGVLADECAGLLTDFFARRREKP